jgi:site-specific DNA-methyltransferase (cytosine-N4-specific)
LNLADDRRAAVVDLSRWLDTVVCGDAVETLRLLPDASADAVISDPPYAEVKRDYGRWTEAEWWALMVDGVVPEVRRVLKPTGSAVFILQPNSRKVGSMRGWVFEFMAWVCREWNMVQDAYWWNITALPTVHSHRDNGLLRPSTKPCVWCGPPDCQRDQASVLWDESESNKVRRNEARAGRQQHPSGHSVDAVACTQAALRRGGVTPFNLIPISNTDSQQSAGAHGHGAGTPLPLARWWTRYICPPGGVALDMFMGAGTMALAAIAEGRHFVGIERDAGYCAIAEQRIAAARRAHQPALALVGVGHQQLLAAALEAAGLNKEGSG